MFPEVPSNVEELSEAKEAKVHIGWLSSSEKELNSAWSSALTDYIDKISN